MRESLFQSLRRCGSMAMPRGGEAAAEAIFPQHQMPPSSKSRALVDELQQQQQGKKKAMSKTKLKRLHKQELERDKRAQVVKAFSDFYENQYGQRWSAILDCLKTEPRLACLVNKYGTRPLASPAQEQVHFLKLPVLQSSSRFPHPERDSKNLYGYYLLDAASVLVAEAMELEFKDNVLDMCAAPGGKSLAILQQLTLPAGSLTANEPSESRRRRLAKVIDDYVPQAWRHCVQITKRNGAKWGHGDQFDKVLVDAPCSSERHLLHDSSEMRTWTPRRTGNCAKRQLLLLSAALRCVKLDGLVVYSTCSISYQENDGVISRAFKKGKTDFEVVRKDWKIGEPTEHGWIVLPDACQGWGPIYFAVLKKVSVSHQAEDEAEDENEDDEEAVDEEHEDDDDEE